jgi:hypothetical protein
VSGFWFGEYPRALRPCAASQRAASPLGDNAALKRHLILDRECAPTLDPELIALDDTVVQAVLCDRLVDFARDTRTPSIATVSV